MTAQLELVFDGHNHAHDRASLGQIAAGIRLIVAGVDQLRQPPQSGSRPINGERHDTRQLFGLGRQEIRA